MNKQFLIPDWPAPQGVKSFITTSSFAGHSQDDYANFNLAMHVGDNELAVQKNRDILQNSVGKENSLQWLNQVHGTEVFKLVDKNLNSVPTADAIYTQLINRVCGVLTADCLPVLFCDESGNEIAIAHAGWRGLVAGVLENTLSSFKAKPEKIMVWLGPAIGPCHFEVGAEVKEQFLKAASHDGLLADKINSAFLAAKSPDKWMANIFQLAKIRLSEAGITQIYGSDVCTYCEEKHSENTFYSYRKRSQTGRFASIIYKI